MVSVMRSVKMVQDMRSGWWIIWAIPLAVVVWVMIGKAVFGA